MPLARRLFLKKEAERSPSPSSYHPPPKHTSRRSCGKAPERRSSGPLVGAENAGENEHHEPANRHPVHPPRLPPLRRGTSSTHGAWISRRVGQYRCKPFVARALWSRYPRRADRRQGAISWPDRSASSDPSFSPKRREEFLGQAIAGDATIRFTRDVITAAARLRPNWWFTYPSTWATRFIP